MEKKFQYRPKENSKAGEYIECLRGLVSKKKANDQNVSAELLKTKYKASYDNLLREISDMACRVLNCLTLGSFTFGRDGDGRGCYGLLRRKINELNRGTFGRDCWSLLMDEYDVDGFVVQVRKLRETLLPDWLAYWRKCCVTCRTSENIGINGVGMPRIYNTLTRDFLVDVETNTWESHPEWIRKETA